MIYSPYHFVDMMNNTHNIKTLQPDEIYNSTIQGALTLHKWVRSIEVASDRPEMRKKLAIQKLDQDIQSRLGDNIHSISWDSLKKQLYRFVTPSSFQNALTKLYRMEYLGEEHPATFFMQIDGYIKTLQDRIVFLNIDVIHMKKNVIQN